MAVLFAQVQSAQGVSSLVALSPSVGTWALHVPSMTGQAVRIQFATDSNASDFGTLWTFAQEFIVTSSAARPATVTFQPPTPWCRVQVQNSVSATMSFTLFRVAAV